MSENFTDFSLPDKMLIDVDRRLISNKFWDSVSFNSPSVPRCE